MFSQFSTPICILCLVALLKATLINSYCLPTNYIPPFTMDLIIPCVERPRPCAELILPPSHIQLPPGLGFGAAALPAVAKAYNQKFFINGPCYDFTDAYVPISSPCSCIKLATPLCQDWPSSAYPAIF